MEAHRVEALWQSITRIEAQEQLSRLSVETYPHSRDVEREKYHREMFTLAHPNHVREKNYITIEEAQKALGNGK